jgi:hypothetical protein
MKKNGPNYRRTNGELSANSDSGVQSYYRCRVQYPMVVWGLISYA